MEKREFVHYIFEHIAKNYDQMNEIISFGRNHAIKKRLVDYVPFEPDAKILDIALLTTSRQARQSRLESVRSPHRGPGRTPCPWPGARRTAPTPERCVLPPLVHLAQFRNGFVRQDGRKLHVMSGNALVIQKIIQFIGRHFFHVRKIQIDRTRGNILPVGRTGLVVACGQ